MAREAEVRRAGSAHRHHVLGRAVGRLAHDPAVHVKAERFQRSLEDVEHFAAGGRDARAADQLSSKLNGIDWICHASP